MKSYIKMLTREIFAKKTIFTYFLFWIITITFLPVYGQENETTTSTNIFESINRSSGIAQWAVVVILIITAFVISHQISNQNRIKKGENFLKMLDYLNNSEFQISYDLVDSLYKKDKKRLEKPDSELTPDLKSKIIKIRETWELIGSMMFERMIDERVFLTSYALNGRDAWKMLKENINQTNLEITDAELIIDTYYKLFRYIGIMCEFWFSFSPNVRRNLIDLKFNFNPNSFLFILVNNIRKITKSEKYILVSLPGKK